jgi:hypothetical protein
VLTHVEFRSDRFPPYEGEEEQINPGIFGKRLAEFVRDGLRKEGFEASAPGAEDWGWVVPIPNPQFSLWIGCGNYQEYPDGFLCFIEPHTPSIRKLFKKVATRERVSALQAALDRVLSGEVGIRSKRWWTHDEFMHPAS